MPVRSRGQRACGLVVCLLLAACADGTEDTDRFEGPAVVINEVLASNQSTNPDSGGDFDDWFELYNPTDQPVDISGWKVTDGYGDKIPFQIANGAVVEPGEFLLFWADDDTEQGVLHTNFKLSADGETLTLLTPDEYYVDEVTFGAQEPDVSWGRSPDGASAWSALTPTPEGPNADP